MLGYKNTEKSQVLSKANENGSQFGETQFDLISGI
jgi:hypothetical protein